MMTQWRKYCTILILVLMMCAGLALDGFAAPKKNQKPAAIPKETITYVVQKGDSVDKIAKKFDVSSNDVAKWNNLSDISKIKIGQKLRLRVPKNSQAAKASKSNTSGKAQNNNGKNDKPEMVKGTTWPKFQGKPAYPLKT